MRNIINKYCEFLEAHSSSSHRPILERCLMVSNRCYDYSPYTHLENNIQPDNYEYIIHVAIFPTNDRSVMQVCFSCRSLQKEDTVQHYRSL